MGCICWLYLNYHLIGYRDHEWVILPWSGIGHLIMITNESSYHRSYAACCLYVRAFVYYYYNYYYLYYYHWNQWHMSKMENKIINKLSLQLHKHLRHKKIKDTPQVSNQRLTAPWNPPNVPVSNTVSRRSFYIQTGAGRNHLDNSNSNRRAATAARLCHSLVEADDSSLNKKWF